MEDLLGSEHLAVALRELTRELAQEMMMRRNASKRRPLGAR